MESKRIFVVAHLPRTLVMWKLVPSFELEISPGENCNFFAGRSSKGGAMFFLRRQRVGRNWRKFPSKICKKVTKLLKKDFGQKRKETCWFKQNDQTWYPNVGKGVTLTAVFTSSPSQKRGYKTRRIARKKSPKKHPIMLGNLNWEPQI